MGFVPQVFLERVETRLPLAAAAFHPTFNVLEPSGLESIDTPSAFPTTRHEPGLAQQTKVSRDRGLADTELPDDLADVALVERQQLENPAAGGVGEGREGFHETVYNK